MIIFKKTSHLNSWLSASRVNRASIGFVPTMGALHQGHLSLVAASVKQNVISIVSIFVNPTQFNNASDFQKYPITIARDVEMLEEAGCTILFLPDVQEIYPQGIKDLESYNIGHLETILEGHFRPAHFQGVCQVMNRLLKIVQPTHLYMGQKDFQQCMVVTRLLEREKLPIEMHIEPTTRETDGLAMSSRNMRLTPVERTVAASIYQQMEIIKSQSGTKNITLLKKETAENLLANGFSSIDYVEIANPFTLLPLAEWPQKETVVILIAAFLNEVRLIDNMVINL